MALLEIHIAHVPPHTDTQHKRVALGDLAYCTTPGATFGHIKSSMYFSNHNPYRTCTSKHCTLLASLIRLWKAGFETLQTIVTTSLETPTKPLQYFARLPNRDLFMRWAELPGR
jgi:hypothetical protein